MDNTKNTNNNMFIGSKFFTGKLEQKHFNALQKSFNIGGYTKHEVGYNGYSKICIHKDSNISIYQSNINYELTKNRSCFLVYRYETITKKVEKDSEELIGKKYIEIGVLEDMLVFTTFKEVVNFIEKDTDMIYRFLTEEEFNELYE